MPSDQPNRRGTGRLNLEDHHTLVVPVLGGFDPRVGVRDTTFYPVPATYRTISNPPIWRVLLKFGGRGVRELVGLDIYGDIVLGRGTDDPDSPDIDLSNLNALQAGVSRRHAMLRPTQHKLHLIDLGSTNGTFVNALPVSKGMAQTLRSSDTMELGGLTCTIEIVFSPLTRQGIPEVPTGELKSEAIPTTLQVGKPKTGTETIIGGKLNLPKPSSSPLGDIPPMTSADLDRRMPDEDKN